jgi:pimeloyl-ACP methyl ester carboxylesterase
MVTKTECDRELETAQRRLLERLAPDVRVGRVGWSGGETQMLELGVGSPLLLIHGGLDNAFSWAPILPALARDRRVIAVDLPGHGLADPFDFAGANLPDHARTFLREILDALELPTVDIVASSIGALYVLALALSAPERVSRLVLVGAPAGSERPGAPLQLRLLALPLVGRRLGRMLMSNPTRDGNRKFWGQVLVTHSENLDDAQLDADVASQRRNIDAHLSLISCVADAGGVRKHLILGERWQTLRVPTLLLWGERDTFGRAEAGEAIAARNPNIRIARIPGAGHLPWFDDPQRVVDEIHGFIPAAGEHPQAQLH